MPDNMDVRTATGAIVTVAAKEIGGVKHQRMALTVGGPGEAADLAPGQADKDGSLPFVLASDDDVHAELGAINEAAPGSDTADAGLNGRLKRIAQNLTAGFGTKVTAVAGLGAGGLGVIGWLSQIWDKLNSSVKTVGVTSYVDVILTLDTLAYASGDVLAETQVITDAMRAVDVTGVLQSVVVIDEDDQGAALDLVFFSANRSLGTENSGPSISDSNARDCLGIVSIASGDLMDFGGVRVASKNGLGLVVKSIAGTRDLAVAAISRGTGTYTVNGIRLRLGIFQD